eukprot:CAMPEP_0178375350 /NCGR_PEP_ID=MMETSP0689_2-20121128/2841_1 /TAXON_ID=160604 /ORGANISM="Amphidinium massartii, Strain CS-259" /LENGTH=163 /DNA_ID=CAMNT_0019995337 /DNA_START=284 /DNA_END=772 /DNA_ORIENTATION=+
MAGTALTAYSDSTISFWGVTATLCMILSFAATDNAVKRSYEFPDALDASNMWFRTCQVSTLVAAPAAVLELMRYPLEPAFYSVSNYAFVVASAIAFFLFNQAVTELLSRVSMSTFAILGSIRRAVTIMSVLLMFGEEITALNLIGLSIVCIGFAVIVIKELYA